MNGSLTDLHIPAVSCDSDFGLGFALFAFQYYRTLLTFLTTHLLLSPLILLDLSWSRSRHYQAIVGLRWWAAFSIEAVCPALVFAVYRRQRRQGLRFRHGLLYSSLRFCELSRTQRPKEAGFCFSSQCERRLSFSNFARVRKSVCAGRDTRDFFSTPSLLCSIPTSPDTGRLR